MARDFQIQGESLVLVKGRSDGGIANLSQLGLADSPINVSFEYKQDDCLVDAWGDQPADIQVFGAVANVSMTLVHFDPTILAYCVQQSLGNGLAAEGTLARAGQRLGNNKARFAPASGAPDTGNNAGNNLIGLNITAPVDNLPWRFLYAFLSTSPLEWPLGAKRSVVRLNWRAIPYTQDPYGGGTGSFGAVLYDRTLDT